jgi:hypothetical protein
MPLHGSAVLRLCTPSSFPPVCLFPGSLMLPAYPSPQAVKLTVTDSLIPRSIYVKGYKKVSFGLMAAVLYLAAVKYLQLFI